MPKQGPNRGNAGKGRPKGTPNKTTALLKDAILQAADEAGGADGLVGYLREQAKQNPGPFLALVGKVLPLQLEHAGKDGAPLVPVLNVFTTTTDDQSQASPEAAGRTQH